MAGGRWIRLNADYADSAWLDALPGDVRRLWPDVLCWVKLKGVGGVCKAPDLEVIAKRLDTPRERLSTLLHAAVQDGAMEVTKDTWVVTNWAVHQPYDLTATERQRKHRAKVKAAADNAVPFPKERSR